MFLRGETQGRAALCFKCPSRISQREGERETDMKKRPGPGYVYL